jgi:hypothetical protein
MILLQDEGPNSANVVNSAIMASAEMGHRHCRKADSSARQLYLHGNRSGVFHKMDRGKVAHKRELHNNQKVLLAEHSLSIRGTQTYNSGQRKILRQHNVQRILSVDWHEGCLRISVSPQLNRAVEKANGLIFQAMKKYWRERRKVNGWRSCQWQYGAITQQSVKLQTSHCFN